MYKLIEFNKLLNIENLLNGNKFPVTKDKLQAPFL